MKSHLQCIEVGHLTDLDDELAINDEGIERHRTKVHHDFREEPRQGLTGLGSQLDLLAPAKGKASKAIPFGLVLPTITHGQFGYQSRLHGSEHEGYSQSTELTAHR